MLVLLAVRTLLILYKITHPQWHDRLLLVYLATKKMQVVVVVVVFSH